MGRLVVAGVVLASLVVPATASAVTCPYDPYDNPYCYSNETVRVSDVPSYKGWAQLEAPGTSYAGPATAGPLPTPAYRWTGSSWSYAPIPGGTRVYAWPFGAGWTWVWTSSTGWRATQAKYVVIHFGLTSCQRMCA